MDHESPATETRARVTVRRLRTAWMLGLLSMVMAMATAPGALPVGARLALVVMCATLLALAGWFWKGRVFDGALTVEWSGEAFADAIVWCLDHPDEAAAMAARGRRWIGEHRTYDRLGQLVYDQLVRVVGKP